MYRHFSGKGNLPVGKNNDQKTRFTRGMTLGDDVDNSEEIYDDLEAYVCALYGLMVF